MNLQNSQINEIAHIWDVASQGVTIQPPKESKSVHKLPFYLSGHKLAVNIIGKMMFLLTALLGHPYCLSLREFHLSDPFQTKYCLEYQLNFIVSGFSLSK